LDERDIGKGRRRAVSLFVIGDGVGFVRLFQPFDLFVAELQRETGDRVIETVGLAGADDRCGGAGFREYPGQAICIGDSPRALATSPIGMTPTEHRSDGY
jgi:hypothetical protein